MGGPRAVAAAGALAVAALGGCQPTAFETRFRDDFTGTALASRWTTYLGTPSSDPYATWTAARVRVADGALVLDAVPIASRPGFWQVGGLADTGDPQTYGRWTIRFRATPSTIASYHLLLWPQDDSWPPEIDIAEGWDADRRQIEGFVHWADGAGTLHRERVVTAGTFDAWHTVVLTWTPGLITWTLDGAGWGRVTGAAVPAEPMRLSMQLETQACDRSSSACTVDARTTVPRLEVDSVLVERYTA